MEAMKKVLTLEEAEQAAGGNIPDGPGYLCGHNHKEKTGAEREDSRWIFFTQHQFGYYCYDCK